MSNLEYLKAMLEVDGIQSDHFEQGLVSTPSPQRLNSREEVFIWVRNCHPTSGWFCLADDVVKFSKNNPYEDWEKQLPLSAEFLDAQGNAYHLRQRGTGWIAVAFAPPNPKGTAHLIETRQSLLTGGGTSTHFICWGTSQDGAYRPQARLRAPVEAGWGTSQDGAYRPQHSQLGSFNPKSPEA